MEVNINRNLSSEDLENLRKNFEANHEITNIIYGEGVDFDTIKLVNELLVSINSGRSIQFKPKQEFRKTIDSEEFKRISGLGLEQGTFSVRGSLTEDMVYLEELGKYLGMKDDMMQVVRELELSQLETSAFVYSRIRDSFVIDNENDKTTYQSVLSGSASKRDVNLLLFDVLRSLGIDCVFNNNGGNFSINVGLDDQKYGVSGTYPFDIATDMIIKESLKSLESGEFNEKFAEGLDRETKDKVFEVVSKKLKSLSDSIIREQSETKVMKERTDLVLPSEELKKEERLASELAGSQKVENGTYALPVDAVKDALPYYSEKKIMNSGVLEGKTFLEREGIKDEASFGEFLVKSGANSELVKMVVNENVSGYYPVIESRSGSNVLLKTEDGKTVLYVPTIEHDNHSLRVIVTKSGSITTVSNEYSNYMESGIRYGSVSVLDFEQNEAREVKLEQKTSRITEVGNITPEMITPVYDVSARKQIMLMNGGQTPPVSDESVSVVCTIENGKMVASNIDEAYKVERLRELGFDEKHYTKRSIAGLNKYSDGREEYLQIEPLDLDESGLIVTKDVALVKTSGKINVLLISSLVGFIFGLGIGLALLILKFS